MSQEEELTHDTVFNLLSSARRRFVLYHLRKADGPVDIGDLTDEVAAWENDVEVDELTRQQRKRVYVSLHQTHIPKLAELGIVEYDQDSGTISLTDRVREIRPYLGEERNDTRWLRYYGALVVVGVLVYLAIASEIVQVGPTARIVVGFLLVLAFGVVALAQYLDERNYREEFVVTEDK